jgi:hypothetical protein
MNSALDMRITLPMNIAGYGCDLIHNNIEERKNRDCFSNGSSKTMTSKLYGKNK